MNLFHVVLLSIIEGITEFLPVSSTGHLILASHLLGIPPTAFTKSFDIAIQLGAIAAIVTLYAKTLLTRKDLWLKLGVALTPTLGIGFFLYPFIRSYLLESTTITAAALIGGGVVLWALEHMFSKQNQAPAPSLPLKNAFGIGMFQSLAVVPGVSRAASTIMGGMLLGLSRKDAVEFSFLLAVPTMMAATGLDLVKQGALFSSSEIVMLLVGMGVAWITAMIAVRFFVRYVQHNTLIPFAIYRILLGLAFFFVGR